MLTLREHLDSAHVLDGVFVAHLLSCFCQCLWIVHSRLTLRFTQTLIKKKYVSSKAKMYVVFCSYFQIFLRNFLLLFFVYKYSQLKSNLKLLVFKSTIIIFRFRRGHHGRMVVGFTTNFAINVYHHWICEFESHSGDTTLCN
jgi:hypothetical protein